MKCQILFSGKNKKNSFNLSSAELAQREVKFKMTLAIDTLQNFFFFFKFEQLI